MTKALFDPSRHRALCVAHWSADLAAAAIEAIGAQARQGFDPETWWPTHPLDLDEAQESIPEASIFLGGAGVILSLHDLARTGFLSAGPSFSDALPAMLTYNRAALSSNVWRQLLDTGWQTRSWLFGDAGILFAQWTIDPAAEVLNRLADVVAANSDDRSREFMWGAAGTMLAAISLHRATGERRWAELYVAGADALQHNLDALGPTGEHLWQQELYCRTKLHLGAVHGFAGNVFAIAAGRHLLNPARWQCLLSKFVDTIHRTAQHSDAGVNWPTTLEQGGDQPPLLQHCHGAPGMITCLAGLDASTDELFLRAGELIWHAGPLAKGAGLCHGTAGNGYALLRLFEISGDEMWLDRARAFAMHAICQAEADRASYGQPRYSLWTGDLGVAFYLRDCISAVPRFPTMCV